MDEKASRLFTHRRNIERYENLQRSKLSATELRFVERRLSEERFALATLQFMSSGNSHEKIELPAVPNPNGC